MRASGDFDNTRARTFVSWRERASGGLVRWLSYCVTKCLPDRLIPRNYRSPSCIRFYSPEDVIHQDPSGDWGPYFTRSATIGTVEGFSASPPYLGQSGPRALPIR